MYFNAFKKIYYDFKVGDRIELKTLTDITRNVRLRKQLLSNITIFDFYDMKEGETPEIVAKRVYGNSNLHWIIMLANDRYDYIEDFPMTAYQLENHINRKYGNNRNAIHHYEKDGYIVDPTVELGAVGVSNADYEYGLNDSKRRIKLLRVDAVSTIIKEFQNLMERETVG